MFYFQINCKWIQIVDNMNVIDKNIETEIIVNKSRFITNLFYVETEDEAKEKLNIIKKKYFDARHNCFAYILGLDGDKKKQSDDGEPSGTAGIPILMSLQNKNITNCIAITTRYFGGVLLGTGGLYKAYSDSSEKSIDSINLISVKQGFLIDMYIDYKNFDLLMKYLSDDKGFIIEIIKFRISNISIINIFIIHSLKFSISFHNY